jgi:hypothetical protein
MDINAHFLAFLETAVNLKQWKLDQLDEHVTAIVNAVQKDSVLGPMYKEYISQGSWAHETIIQPVGDLDEFDADFLLHISEDDEWSEWPSEYLRQLRAAFKRTAAYREKVIKKNRCVRIDYKNDCHVDVVPHLTLGDGRQVIINYKEDKFEDTNPAGFTDWMKERDDLTGGNFRKVIRLLKYLRDYKNTFSCPSVILTTLLGQRVQAFDQESRYSDIPTTLISLLDDLEEWLYFYSSMPYLEDPSCPGTSFNHRWKEEQYRNFKDMTSKYAGWAREARDAQEDGAIAAWQKMFGPDFVALEVEAAARSIAGSLNKSTARVMVQRAPDEKFMAEEGYRLVAKYMARIEGRIEELKGFRSRPLRSLSYVNQGARMRFKLVTDAPPPFQVIWKVRNRGEAATLARDLRGQLIPGESGSLYHTENAKYPGRHYIEVYVLRQGIVVATDHHEVVIV